MPIYEYGCENCGREFEEWQKFSDPPVTQCRECGGHTRRLISQSTFVLKGTGWYVTDYGRSSSCSSSKKTPDTKESSATTTGTPSDSGASKES
jgi:putative FmdB family regulatory protein